MILRSFVESKIVSGPSVSTIYGHFSKYFFVVNFQTMKKKSMMNSKNVKERKNPEKEIPHRKSTDSI